MFEFMMLRFYPHVNTCLLLVFLIIPLRFVRKIYDMNIFLCIFYYKILYDKNTMLSMDPVLYIKS